MGSLFLKSWEGLRWGLLTNGGMAVCQLVSTVVMARLLVPEDFGLAAMATLAIRLLEYFSRMGLYQVVVQREGLTEKAIRSAFSFSWLTGLVFTLFAWWFSPHLAGLLEEPMLTDVLRLVSISLFVNGLFAVPTALARRALHFRKMALYQLWAYIAGYWVVGIFCAWQGLGAYALVVASLTYVVVQGALCSVLVKPDIRPLFSLAAFGPLFQTGSRISLAGFTEFLAQTADTAWLTLQFPAATLGHYNRAYYVAYLPLFQLIQTFSNVFFPVLSRLQSAGQTLEKTWLQANRACALLLFPLGWFMAALADPLVRVVLGEGWEETVAALQFLGLLLPFSLMNGLPGMLCEAMRKVTLKLRALLVYLGILCIWLVLQPVSVSNLFWGMALAELGRYLTYALGYHLLFRNGYPAYLSSWLPGLGVASGVGLVSIAAAAWEHSALGALLPGAIGAGFVWLLAVIVWPVAPIRAFWLDTIPRLLPATTGRPSRWLRAYLHYLQHSFG